MEVRIAKMEKELGIMSASLTSISKALDRISEVHMDTKLLESKLMNLDRDLQESFIRVHKRIDEEKNARVWATRIIVGGFLLALTKFMLTGGLVNV